MSSATSCLQGCGYCGAILLMFIGCCAGTSFLGCQLHQAIFSSSSQQQWNTL
jgi:hypothetical protein